jgi:Cyclopropane fatty acid synthase and related methyltransferases
MPSSDNNHIAAHWKNYWSKNTDGYHRFQSEDFLEKESKEKLFLLEGGNSLLDFGCGSADLLSYYSRVYDFCVGVDFSELLLEKAKERLQQFGSLHKVQFIHADESQVWTQIDNLPDKDRKFDRITAGQVIQYFDKEQVEKFICNSLNYLSEEGSICLFDVVDSRIFELWDAGLYEAGSFNSAVAFRLIINRIRTLKRKITKKPLSHYGYLYAPSYFESLAKQYNLKISIVNSMYYEYRYHVIIQTNCD